MTNIETALDVLVSDIACDIDQDAGALGCPPWLSIAAPSMVQP